jgi:multiple sugar transport system permease protein
MTLITRSRTQAQPTAPARSRIRQFPVGSIVPWILMLLLILITIFPFFWVLRTSLTSYTAVYENTGSLLPVNPTLDNFGRVLGLIDPSDFVIKAGSNITPGTLNFPIFLRNSFIVAALVAGGQTFFSSMAAYAFAQLKFPGSDKLFFLYLTGLMIPAMVLLIPNFILIRQLGWIGTFQGIVAPAFLMSPFAVFFMRQFFLSLNHELEEAALLDGATAFGVFWRVAVPLMRGPLLTQMLLIFIGSWNDYLWPLLVGRDENVRVLTVALGIFREQTPQGAPDWSGLMSGTLIAIVPTILLFVFFGRRVVDSIQFSGFK